MYILDNANVFRECENRFETRSLVIKNKKVDYITKNTQNYKLIKTDYSSYSMYAGFTMLDYSFNEERAFREVKDYFINQFLRYGCTTILAIADVFYESKLKGSVELVRTNLLSSPVDYIIAVKTSLKNLSASFIRRCKMEKIPAIIVEINNVEELTEKAWPWIRNASYSYRAPLIPYWTSSDDRTLQRLKKEWSNLLDLHKIPHIKDPIPVNYPLTNLVLEKIGIHPIKSTLHIGAQLDYNLYNYETQPFAQLSNLHYDRVEPIITVHRGEVIKVGADISFRPGNGEEHIIKVPGFFAG